MAFFEDMFKGNLGTGLAVGIGAAVIGPLVAPVVGAVLRPAAKAVIKAGLLAYDAGREGAARIGELGGDVVAEARSELNEARAERGTEEPRAAARGKTAASGTAERAHA